MKKIFKILSTLLISFMMFSCSNSADSSEISFYTVTIADGITNGTVEASRTREIKAGETITLTVNPADGYECSVISVKCGDDVVAVTENTFEMPAGDVTVSAIFSTILIGTKAPNSVKAVGDIVFTDGSASPYTEELTDEQKAAAIAVIFYAGDENDTLGEKTLGVGLKEEKTKWCLWEASAGVKNQKTVDTILCIPTGETGAYIFDEDADKDGSDNLEQISQWLKDNNIEDDTSKESNYPAFYFAKNYKTTALNVSSTSYEYGWYIPSFAELFELWKQISTVNAAINECGEQIIKGHYLSSSEDPAYSAYILYISNGEASHTNTYSEEPARVIHTF